MALQPRLATPYDVPEMVRLRRELFGALGVVSEDNTWERHCAGLLTRGLYAGSLIGAVVEHPDGDSLVAVGTAEIEVGLPGPNNPDGRRGHIGTMCTDAAWRRQGLGDAVLDVLLVELTAQGLTRIELHATADGEGIYRRRGFVERPGGLEMRLAVPPSAA
jgi:ribosomal protein S18 acetylase RimI-like enzyme